MRPETLNSIAQKTRRAIFPAPSSMRTLVIGEALVEIGVRVLPKAATRGRSWKTAG